MMQEYIKVSHSGVATGKECKSYTWSPFVHLPWLACCGRWNFLRDTGGVHQIRTVFTICLCIYLYFRCKVNSALIQLCTQKSYSHNRKENSHLFSPEIKPLFFGPNSKPPHSYRSPTWLPVLVTQFRYLLLTVFLFKSLCR